MNAPHAISSANYAERWRTTMAPRTGDVRYELTVEAAEFFGITLEEAQRRVATSGEDFPAEWHRLVDDPSDKAQVSRFYSESRTELFEQIAWHSTEPIHHRSFVCADLATSRPGRSFLDYGSGIGSNALVFGLAGFDVTLADIADPLLNFAKWRCEKRGLRVRTVDLKTESLETSRYDVVTCFDVLEHVPEPLKTLRQLSRSIQPGGVFFFYAPIGYDPVRPMHIVHDAHAVRRIRSLGFQFLPQWSRKFPAEMQTHSVYLRVQRSAMGNFAYYVRDVWLRGRAGAALGRALRGAPPMTRRTA